MVSGEAQLDAVQKELNVAEALSLAMQLHQAGDLGNAETLYRRILRVAPDDPDALHFFGVLLHHRGRTRAALDLIEKSIALDSYHAGRFVNMGNVLVEIGRLPEAAWAYNRAIELDPNLADAFNNLGAVLKAQARVEEAATCYREAIQRDPQHVDAHTNLGNLLSSQGKVREAVGYYCKAITLAPGHPHAKKLLGIAYYTIGQSDAAADVFREWLASEPTNPVAEHMLAACSGENVPLRASNAYIESTFDAFAETFDEKLERLCYRAPQLIVEALARTCGGPEKRWVVLDAGCGTGLCGPLLAPYAQRLVGVDLSSRVLAKARGRDVYDETIKDELTAYLSRHADVFDLIASADTLVYFGSLQAAFNGAARALRPRGVLAFTVEELATEKRAFRINPHGRYSHSRAYLEETLRAAGFSVLLIDPAVLRMEGGDQVAGLTVAARKSAQEMPA